jgi:hypothetical protein
MYVVSDKLMEICSTGVHIPICATGDDDGHVPTRVDGREEDVDHNLAYFCGKEIAEADGY